MKQSESLALDAFLSFWKEKNTKRKLVSQKEYYTWLIGFMVGRGVKKIETESILYDNTLTEDNRKKLLAISELFSLIEDYCYMHGIKQKIHETKKISFPHGEYIIEGDGYYFSILTVVGQGAITILTMLSEIKQGNHNCGCLFSYLGTSIESTNSFVDSLFLNLKLFHCSTNFVVVK